jgi:histone-lysine N-methyltransferase SETD8
VRRCIATYCPLSQVRTIEEKGRGVFATRNFRRNEFVCEYSGELISPNEAEKREKRYSEDSSIGCYMYYLQFNNKKYW